MAGSDEPLCCPYCDGNGEGHHQMDYFHKAVQISTHDGTAVGYGDYYVCLYCQSVVVYLAHENEYIEEQAGGEYVDQDDREWTVIDRDIVLDVRTEEEKNKRFGDDWPTMFDED